MSIERLKSMEEKAMCLAEQGLNQDVSSIDAKELGEIIDVVKDLAETKYYCSITKAMEESEEAEKYMQKYLPEMAYARGDIGDRYYTLGRGGRPMGTTTRGNGGMRNTGNNGGATTRTSGRRNYSRPREIYTDPYMEDMMDPELYNEMYNHNPHLSEYDGDAWKYRRTYMENKHEHGKDSDSSKELTEYAQSLTNDVLDMVENATPQEKAMLKQKLDMLSSKIE